MKETIKAPGLPYSRAVIIPPNKTLIEVSGQIGLKEGVLVEGIEAQTKQVMENLKAVLSEAETDLEHVIKCRIYLTDMSHYDIVNSIYKEYFENYPARVAVAVKELPLKAMIEIECLAIK